MTNVTLRKMCIRDSRNWHCGKKELDIVAEYRNELIVIEVKTRKNTRFGNPEDAVTAVSYTHLDVYKRQAIST